MFDNYVKFPPPMFAKPPPPLPPPPPPARLPVQNISQSSFIGVNKQPSVHTSFTNLPPSPSLKHSSFSSMPPLHLPFRNMPPSPSSVPFRKSAPSPSGMPSFKTKSPSSSVHSSFSNRSSSPSSMHSQFRMGPPLHSSVHSFKNIPPSAVPKMTPLKDVSLPPPARTPFTNTPPPTSCMQPNILTSHSVQQSNRNIPPPPPLQTPSMRSLHQNMPSPLSSPSSFVFNRPPPSFSTSVPPRNVKYSANDPRSFMKAFNPVPNSRQNRTVDGGVPCANAKKSNQTLVKRPVCKPFSCDNCILGFSTKRMLDDHIAKHVTCKVTGCAYTAIPSLMLEHTAAIHPDLKSIVTDEIELEALIQWREKRKKQYPTVKVKIIKDVTPEINGGIIAENECHRNSNSGSKVLNGDTEDSVKSESITEMNEDIQILRKSDLTQLSSDRVNSSRELELIKKTDNDVDMTHFNNDCPSTEVNDKDDIVSQPVVICDDNKKLDLMTFEDDIPQDDTLYGDINHVKQEIDRMMKELDNSINVSKDSCGIKDELPMSKNKSRKRKRRTKRCNGFDGDWQMITNSTTQNDTDNDVNTIVASEPKITTERDSKIKDDRQESNESDSDTELNAILAGNDRTDCYICPIDGRLKRRTKPSYLLNKIFDFVEL